MAGRFAAATTERYNATKFGVTAFTEALRQEYAQNITCVCPSSSQAGWTPSC
ncbi:SDR family NAD(P)-dependent oxidoreductase [Mycobacterium aquaticum]|uniref:SDR family NAD(P)-dependent oxidoreductase n=1 Tax=Mycobacterium aquaticum TaxID=1927124 RepID=UPI001FE76221|nr:SDR family NAD(P)-dependent oxidoreductase [Mycobacterium aquaticum]